jgi:hypothetical protein
MCRLPARRDQLGAGFAMSMSMGPAGCCGSDGAGAAAVYEVFGSSQVAGVVGYEEGA